MAQALLPATALSSGSVCAASPCHRRPHTHASAAPPQAPQRFVIVRADAATERPSDAATSCKAVALRRPHGRRRAVSARAAAADGPGGNHHHHSHHHNHHSPHEDDLPSGAPHENGTHGAHGLSASPNGPYRNLSPGTLNNISVFSLPSDLQQPQRVPEPALAATAGTSGGSGGGAAGRSGAARRGEPRAGGGGGGEGGSAAPDEAAAAVAELGPRRQQGGGGGGGVPDAFTPGREGEARRGIFNRVSRHYDEVCACARVRVCGMCTGQLSWAGAQGYRRSRCLAAQRAREPIIMQVCSSLCRSSPPRS